MIKTLTWQAYSSGERNYIIEELKSAINSSSGYIMNSNIFSDLALNLSIEIEESKVLELHNELSRILNVSKPDINKINLASGKECLISMNISFSKGKGELKNKIPEVPG
jgi:hypothetical protein